jgi:hypothetical protein
MPDARTIYLSADVAEIGQRDAIASLLRAKGYDVWYADSATTDASIQEAVRQHLFARDTFILLLAQRTLAAFWPRVEVGDYLALLGRDPARLFITVQLSDGPLPPTLSALPHIAARQRPVTDVVQDILRLLAAHPLAPVGPAAAATTTPAAPDLERQLIEMQAAHAAAQEQIARLARALDDERRMHEVAEAAAARWRAQAERMQPAPPPGPAPSDPPTYAKEQIQHPHVKVLPVAGPALALDGGWRVLGASVRGRAHHNGHFREDDCAIRPYRTQAALLALADGVGSQAYARWGALAAVQGATGAVSEADLAALVHAARDRSDPAERTLQQCAQAAILAMLAGAVQAVQQTAQANHKAPDELQSTLLVALLVPKPTGDLFVTSAQIGDGALLLRPPTLDGAPRWQTLQAPQPPDSHTTVVPLLHFDAAHWPSLIHMHTAEAGSALVALTDGVLDDLHTPPDPDTGHFADEEDFYWKLRAATNHTSAPAHALAAFLGYHKRGSSDDRTVVCVY